MLKDLHNANSNTAKNALLKSVLWVYTGAGPQTGSTVSAGHASRAEHMIHGVTYEPVQRAAFP